MNSNPILNREIGTTWHGEAQTVERKNMVRAKRQSRYTHKIIDFLTLLDTEQIQHPDHKNTASMLYL